MFYLDLCGATILTGINKNGTARGAKFHCKPELFLEMIHNEVPYGAVKIVETFYIKNVLNFYNET